MGDLFASFNPQSEVKREQKEIPHDMGMRIFNYFWL